MSAVRLENLIKETCQDWSRDVEAPHDLADRVLDRRGHRSRNATRWAIPLAAVATVLVVGLVLALSTQLNSRTNSAPPAVTGDISLHTDPDHYRPTRLVAAGQVALGAYGTLRKGAGPESNGNQETAFEWHVYDAAKDRYVTVPWASVKVAPGLKEAAVLERSGAQRVGLVDLKTRKVTRWLPAGGPVSSVDWSPDTRNLVLTITGSATVSGQTYTVRKGFTVMDVSTGSRTFTSLPMTAPTSGGGLDTMALENLANQAVAWSRTGWLVWVQAPDLSGKRVFYNLKGKQTTPPGHEAQEATESPISPDGTLIATTGADGYGMGPAVSITDLASGKRTKVLILEHAITWADDTHVIGVACEPDDCAGKGEFYNRRVLAGLDGSIVPLTGYGDSQSAQAWTPQFVPRRPR